MTPYDLAIKWEHSSEILKLLLNTNPDIDEYNYITLKFGIFASLYRCICLPSAPTSFKTIEHLDDLSFIHRTITNEHIEDKENGDKLIENNNDNSDINQSIIRERSKFRIKNGKNSSKFSIESDNLHHKLSLTHYTGTTLPIQGLSLQGILQFIERCGGIKKLEQYQMYQIWDKFIIPLTDLQTSSDNPSLPYNPLSNRLLLASSSSTYCDYLHRDNTNNINNVISTPNVYISYKSQVSFIKIFHTILDYFDKFEDGNYKGGHLKTDQERWLGVSENNAINLENMPLLYMDLFSNNLNIDLIDRYNENRIDNSYNRKNCFDWCWSTYHIIKRCQYLVVVIEPFSNSTSGVSVHSTDYDKTDIECKRNNRNDEIGLKNSVKDNKNINNCKSLSGNKNRNYSYNTTSQMTEKSMYMKDLNKINLNKCRVFSIPLRIAWQIYCAYATNSVFEILLSERDKEILFAEISKSKGEIYANLVSINCNVFSTKEYKNNSNISQSSDSRSSDDDSDDDEFNIFRYLSIYLSI
jgi:hypothetical protein